MTRIINSVRLGVAIAVSVIGVLVFSWTSTSAGAARPGTPLPAGWELCILQGLNAPLTQANVANLDEWQVVEGGSTNNTAAYNPFNTGRTTDVNGNPLPIDNKSNGFPAYSNWLAGCAASVATLLQPNMSVVTEALRAGNVAPPAAYLAIVDQSPWCAPSPDGTPCYVNAIVGGTGTLASLPRSSALDVYGNVTADLHSYQQDLSAVSADQATVQELSVHLASTQAGVSDAKSTYGVAEGALRKFAVAEYESSGIFEASSFAGGQPGAPTFGHPTANGVTAEQYASATATQLLSQRADAAAALKASEAQRQQAARALGQAAATLTSDETSEHHALQQLVTDVATMQTAGACTTVALAAASSDTGGGTGSTTTSTSTTTTSTSTTTTSTTTTSTTTTTTTTTPSGPTPTGAVTTGGGSTQGTATTETTPTSTTTTTTTPGSGTSSSSAPATVNPAGVSALQGCVTSFAPPST